VTFLASRKWRLFIVLWVVYSVHFATNVVREHYPAFSLVDHGTFRVDEYQGFHSDIFVHNGHSVIGNQVFVSMLAAVPLWVFDPVLDALERYSREKIACEGVKDVEYRIDKPNRVNFFRLVKERGLDLRFGAATAVTTIFFMAPLTAAFLVFFYAVLVRRLVNPRAATSMTLLLGLGTPLFFRTSSLNHNLFVMYAMFIAFALMWLTPAGSAMTVRRRLLAGLFAGITIATDYIGLVIIPLLLGYFIWRRMRDSSLGTAVLESGAIVAGMFPPIAFLLYSQWAMYGNAFLPGQYWMPDQNIFVHQGMRGFTLPDPQLMLLNLFDPAYGLFTWAPVTVLAFLPIARQGDSAVLPLLERRWVWVTFAALLLFVSSNQYSRLQFNSGFRYLLPLLPLLMLIAADVWRRLGRGARIAITVVAVLHAWVLTVFREPVVTSFRMFLDEGIQLPWYRVLSLTSQSGNAWLSTWWVPAAILVTMVAVLIALWRYGARLEAIHATR
jgi:hypothetical protein